MAKIVYLMLLVMTRRQLHTKLFKRCIILYKLEIGVQNISRLLLTVSTTYLAYSIHAILFESFIKVGYVPMCNEKGFPRMFPFHFVQNS